MDRPTCGVMRNLTSYGKIKELMLIIPDTNYNLNTIILIEGDKK